MFQRCLDDGQYRQALGLALETRRMDIFEASIMQSVNELNIISLSVYQIGHLQLIKKNIASCAA